MLGLLLAALVGYAVGSLNPAAALARARGVDLAGSGSGNPGATNAGRVMGARWGVLVGALDVLKGFVPAYCFTRWGVAGAGAVAGLAAVVGHVTSPLLHGHGGKGVATALGAILGVQPWWALPVLATFGLVVLATRRVGLGAVAGAVVLVPVAVLAHDEWWQVGFAVAVAAVVVVRHGANLAAAWARLRAGRAGDR